MTPRPPMTPATTDPALWMQGLEGATGFTDDSRKVAPGFAYALCARNPEDLRAWARTAQSLGARSVFVDPKDGALPDDVTLPRYLVPGLRSELSRMAAHFYGYPSQSLSVFGVTGTNGKTSCSHWFAQAMRVQGQKCGVIGTLGAGYLEHLSSTGYTTPGPIEVQQWLAEFKRGDAKAVAMEVSSHALTEGRVDAVKFDVALFTNLTHDHLDYHGSFEAYREAKAQLFKAVGLRFAVINLDDEFGRVLSDSLSGDHCEVLTYSQEGRAAHYTAEAIEFSPKGLSFELCAPKGRVKIETSLSGTFNVSNLLGVAASLEATGIEFAALPSILNALTAPSGRMDTLVDERGVRIVIDYAHTPDALKKVLESLRAGLSGRLIVVFGCGGDRDAAKRPLMGAVAEQAADLVILTSDNPRSEDPLAIMAAISGGMRKPPYGQMLDRALAIRLALGLAEKGDAVLIAGKGHESFQEIAGVRHAFSDKAVVEEAMQGALQ